MSTAKFAVGCGLGTMYSTLMITIGHEVLPGIGLASLAAGGGPLSTAAISFLAGGGILLIPAVVLHYLVNKHIKDSPLRVLSNLLLFVGFVVGSYLLAAALYDISSLSLFTQHVAGVLTIATFGVGAVVAMLFLGAFFGGCVAGCINSRSKRSSDYYRSNENTFFNNSSHVDNNIPLAFAVPVL